MPPSPRPSTERRGDPRPLLWGGAALAALLLSPFAPILAGWLPRCPTKALTEIPCPLCGTTRAALALARLDVPVAFAVNPLAAASWILFLVFGLVAGSMALLGLRWALPAFPRWGWWVLGALLLLNWVYLVAHGT